MLHSAKSTSFS